MLQVPDTSGKGAPHDYPPAMDEVMRDCFKEGSLRPTFAELTQRLIYTEKMESKSDKKQARAATVGKN